MIREIEAKALSAAVRTLCIEANTILPQDLRTAVGIGPPQGVAHHGEPEMAVQVAPAHALVYRVLQTAAGEVAVLAPVQEYHRHAGVLADGQALGLGKLVILHQVAQNGLEQVDITVAPKGFGSENMTRLKMFNPSVSQEQVEDFIVECVSRAGSNPCPPVVIGVGLGGIPYPFHVVFFINGQT